MNQPALWADPLWTDAYVPGQPIHDGVRDGIVSAILEDCPGGLAGIGLVVRYPDGHETTFGYDHMLSDALSTCEASDGSTVDCSPAVDPESAGGQYGPATVETPPPDTRSASPVRSHSANEKPRPSCAATTPGL